MPGESPTSRGVPSIRSSRRFSARYFCVSCRFSWTRFKSASISTSLHGLVR